MLLLIFATLYIYRKFSELAAEKDLNKVKWGLIGCFVYLGVGLGLPFTLGVLIALNVFYMDTEDRAVNTILSLISYGIGALVAYLVYRKLAAKTVSTPDVENFGKPDPLSEK